MEKNRSTERKEGTSTSSKLLNRASLASRLTTGTLEVKGISRKEFKPTIPTRRKKHSAPQTPQHHEEASSPVVPDQRFKDRVSGNLATPNKFQKDHKPGDRGRGRGRKEYIRATGGLFGGNDPKLETEDLLASGRTAAELEEEKYIDPFHQSTSETTPITLPINPRIDSKSKLLVGKSTSMADEEKETTVSELLYRPPDDLSESTYLFNLPDLLPVDMKKLELEGENKAEGESKAEPGSIHSLPEGYLGRLQILKSGKARLMIGDVPLEVSLLSKSGFLQEILCCQTQALDRGKIANIGTVPYTLSVSPEFDQLIT